MEIISMNFGQCGIQLANVYWTKVANEIKKKDKDKNIYKGLYKNIDKIELDSENPRYDKLIPRCILVDSEMGPATQVTQDSDKNLISSENIVAGTHAAGNNWATAFMDFGSKYSETIEEMVTDVLEDCDHVEYFNLSFGISGGTGSGLGTYSAQMLSDLYPKIPKLSNIITSTNGSAVSPYNNLLALNMLEKESTLTVPFSNDIIQETIKSRGLAQGLDASKQKTYFGHINNLISDFQYKFNVMTLDSNYPSFRVNSVINSLMPFDNLNYTCPFKSPMKEYGLKETNTLENIYNDLLRPVTRISPIPLDSTMSPIAMAVLTDGRIEHLKYAKALKLKYKMYGWNRDSAILTIRRCFPKKSNFPGEDNSIIALGNHSGISQYLDVVVSNVNALLNKKAFLHHFENFISNEEIRNTMMDVSKTSKDYKSINNEMNQLFYEILSTKAISKSKHLEVPSSLHNNWPLNSGAKTVI